jgi:hypothetical protein
LRKAPSEAASKWWRIAVAERITVECVGPEEFLDYFEGILSQERDAEIEAHLDVCSACQTLARRTLAFSAAWDQWAAPSGAEAVSAAIMAAALLKAEEVVPAWRDRLVAWRRRWGGRTGAAARVLFEAPGEAVRVITEGLEALLLPPVALRTRGAVRVRGTGPPGKPTPPAPRIDVNVVGPDLVVRVTGVQADRRPPLVLLIPKVAGAAPHVAALEVIRTRGAMRTRGTPSPGEPKPPGEQIEDAEGVAVARFPGVGPGEYLVAIEPAERAAS